MILLNISNFLSPACLLPLEHHLHSRFIPSWCFVMGQKISYPSAQRPSQPLLLMLGMLTSNAGQVSVEHTHIQLFCKCTSNSISNPENDVAIYVVITASCQSLSWKLNPVTNYLLSTLICFHRNSLTLEGAVCWLCFGCRRAICWRCSGQWFFR